MAECCSQLRLQAFWRSACSRSSKRCAPAAAVELKKTKLILCAADHRKRG